MSPAGTQTSDSRAVPRTPRRRRRGAIIVLAAILMIVMMAMLALSIDTGYMCTMQTQLDRSVDAAALAGAAMLIDGPNAAQEEVLEYLIRNPVGKQATAVTDENMVELTAKFLAEHANDYEILWGDWDPNADELVVSDQLPSAVSVSMTYPNLPFFFGRVLGRDTFDLTARAIAMYQPRDIVVVLDFSGSMNDDSELKSVSTFGLPALMEGYRQMYAELGSPDYGGVMQVEPRYITVVGAPPADATKPQITVEYRYRSVYVTSSKTLTSVKLQFSDGSTRTFAGSGTTGTFASSNKVVYKAWVKSGTNGLNGEAFDFGSSTIRATIKTALGLNDVAYPYPSGSWNSFIDYCRTNSTNKAAGFEYKFGYANLISYWLEQQPSHADTPDLWKVSAQPVTALKDAVDVFMDYITEVDTNDRVALVIYDAANGNAILESPLTTDLDVIPAITRQRQAAHYHDYTNIGAGMQTARQELVNRGRENAFKMIVLMTDGNANWNNGYYNESAARSHVLSEAAASAALRYPIVSISLGAAADKNLMAQVAEITESRHFNVPGGAVLGDYREGLIEVFRTIADARPLKLVH